MSLRLKALLSAIFLVFMVTGSLGWYVRGVWENREQQRITDDLKNSVADLKRTLSITQKLASYQLELETRSPDLKSLVGGRDSFGNKLHIRDNFFSLANQWKELIHADGILITIDSFFAEDKSREARIHNKFGDLAVTAVALNHSSTDDLDSVQENILEDTELQNMLSQSFVTAEISSQSTWKVLTIANSVWLVVVTPFYEDREQTAVVGQAVALFELSNTWLTKIQSQLLKTENPVLHITYSRDQLAGQTLGDEEISQQVIQKFSQSKQSMETIELTISGKTSRYIALRDFLFEKQNPQFISLKNLDAELLDLKKFIRDLWFWGLGFGFLGTGVAYMMVLTVVRRLDELKMATMKIQEGNFNVQTSIQGSDEVAGLGVAFNKMTEGLKALEHYTDPVIAQAIIGKNEEDLAKGVKAVGCVFFSDIKNFTSISENLNPDEMVEQLNEYFYAMGRNIKNSHGFVDKFIGDSVMAWWGPPFIDEGNLGAAACQAAVSCQVTIKKLREKWERENRPLFYQRIGLSFGEVVVGNLGSESKKNFTVVGDTVNLASRLERANVFYGTEILICGKTAQQIEGFVLREVDQIRVKGRFKPVRIFECLGETNQVPQDKMEMVELYKNALICYRNKNFGEAVMLLKRGCDGGDNPSLWLRARCEALVLNPPGAEWESVTVYREK